MKRMLLPFALLVAAYLGVGLFVALSLSARPSVHQMDSGPGR